MSNYLFNLRIYINCTGTNKYVLIYIYGPRDHLTYYEQYIYIPIHILM